MSKLKSKLKLIKIKLPVVYLYQSAHLSQRLLIKHSFCLPALSERALALRHIALLALSHARGMQQSPLSQIALQPARK